MFLYPSCLQIYIIFCDYGYATLYYYRNLTASQYRLFLIG
ncbi:hypothetical protein HMPREF3226_00300 [Prevotella corporis]|uniref:Uncharacterized protein n=1 Tax=Prevotella corporis TaxID=28128 RepID=A0A133QLT9_9BACT|nr:hypothetical protein HMPREF3226_00300 [Prevotella corporis]